MQTKVFVFLLFVGATIAESSTSHSEEENLVTSHADAKINQCVCNELDTCFEEQKTKMEPCVEKCIAELQHADWNAAEGRKCFSLKDKVSKPPACFQEFKKMTCAAASGVQLNKNETMEFHRHKHNRDAKRSGKPHFPHPSPYGMSRRQFHRLVENVFDKSGKSYKKCVKKCFHSHGHRQCYAKLKCKTRRLSPEEFKSVTAKCPSKSETTSDERREKFCSCLTNSGIKNIDCNAGKSNVTEKNELN